MSDRKMEICSRLTPLHVIPTKNTHSLALFGNRHIKSIIHRRMAADQIIINVNKLSAFLFDFRVNNFIYIYFVASKRFSWWSVSNMRDFFLHRKAHGREILFRVYIIEYDIRPQSYHNFEYLFSIFWWYFLRIVDKKQHWTNSNTTNTSINFYSFN